MIILTHHTSTSHKLNPSELSQKPQSRFLYMTPSKVESYLSSPVANIHHLEYVTLTVEGPGMHDQTKTCWKPATNSCRIETLDSKGYILMVYFELGKVALSISGSKLYRSHKPLPEQGRVEATCSTPPRLTCVRYNLSSIPRSYCYSLRGYFLTVGLESICAFVAGIYDV